jgi:hypothetical protein
MESQIMNNRQQTDLGGLYEICVCGKLSRRWSDWFDGFSVVETNGETLLTGQVADQAALHGVLSQVRDLGLPLLWVKRLGENEEPRPEG